MPRDFEAISLIVIRSKDIDESALFYRQLGMQLAEEKHGNGPRHFATEIGQTVLEIYPLGRKDPTSSLRLGFFVMKLDTILERLGVEAKPELTDYGYQAVINDPDWHTIELTQKSTTD